MGSVVLSSFWAPPTRGQATLMGPLCRSRCVLVTGPGREMGVGGPDRVVADAALGGPKGRGMSGCRGGGDAQEGG